ncbi:unnamed protein product, partial [Ixodes persulcatus]
MHPSHFSVTSIFLPLTGLILLCYKDHNRDGFLSLSLEFNLTQLIKSPTRITMDCSAILDLLLTTLPDVFSDISCLDGLSDHKLVHLYAMFPVPTNVTSRKVIRNYAKGNYDAINANLTVFAQDFLFDFSSRTVEHNWLLFKNIMLDLVEKFVPIISIKTNHSAPWFNRDLKLILNKK